MQPNQPNQPLMPPQAAPQPAPQPMPAAPQPVTPMPTAQPQAVPQQRPQMPQAAPQPAMPQQPAQTQAQTQAQAQAGARPAQASAQQQVSKAPTNVRGNNPNSAQSALLISELRDSMVIMKDGSFRSVVACKSINFDLMSEEERESVEFAYQNFLNSLNFTVQILIRSQRVDIAPYIDRLLDLRRKNDNMLLGVLMDDYINFIDELSQEANIMDKSFFVVIPYYTTKEAEKALEQSKNFFKTFTKDKTPPVTRIDRATYDKAVTEMTNRTEAVISGLFQIGIQSVRLNTKELGQLYYNFNNPDTAVREPLGDFNKLAHLYVKKGDRPAEEEKK